MKAISLDLRQRAVALYRELGSSAEVARRLCVKPRWVGDMVRRFEERGSLEPDYENCGNKPKLSSEHDRLLKAWLAERNDRTLYELQAMLAEKGVVVTHVTVANALNRLKITHKKRPRSPKNDKGPTSRKNVPGGSARR